MYGMLIFVTTIKPLLCACIALYCSDHTYTHTRTHAHTHTHTQPATVVEEEVSDDVSDLQQKLAILQAKRQEDKARLKELEKYRIQVQQVSCPGVGRVGRL